MNALGNISGLTAERGKASKTAADKIGSPAILANQSDASETATKEQTSTKRQAAWTAARDQPSTMANLSNTTATNMSAGWETELDMNALGNISGLTAERGKASKTAADKIGSPAILANQSDASETATKEQTSTKRQVAFSLLVENIAYDALQNNNTARSSFMSGVKQAVAKVAGVEPEAVLVQLSPGSVLVQVTIVAGSPTGAQSIMKGLGTKGRVAEAVSMGLSKRSDVDAVATGTIGVAMKETPKMEAQPKVHWSREEAAMQSADSTATSRLHHEGWTDWLYESKDDIIKMIFGIAFVVACGFAGMRFYRKATDGMDEDMEGEAGTADADGDDAAKEAENHKKKDADAEANAEDADAEANAEAKETADQQ